MPSITPEQQHLFGWALACKRGESDNCPPNVKKLADSMTEEQLKDFASTKHSEMKESVLDAVIECIEQMDNETLDLLEKETKETVAAAKLKPSDVPPIAKDVKTPPPTATEPGPPPGYVAADKRNPPGFFTPSLFKRPGDKSAKRDRRLMDFGEFLKRINYRTHDDTLQAGHGVNLSGGKNS